MVDLPLENCGEFSSISFFRGTDLDIFCHGATSSTLSLNIQVLVFPGRKNSNGFVSVWGSDFKSII